MQATLNKYTHLFNLLTKTVSDFIKEVNKHRLAEMATDEWTVKDELCHIVFWHENYANNYKALAKHQEPLLPQGMSTINKLGVISLRKYPIKELIRRLRQANDSLYVSIVEKQVPRMTYSQGGRTYETAYFLQMITRHINTHSKQVRRAK